MILIRLPWRHWARPSATLHEIQGPLRRADLSLRWYKLRQGFVKNLYWACRCGWDIPARQPASASTIRDFQRVEVFAAHPSLRIVVSTVEVVRFVLFVLTVGCG